MLNVRRGTYAARFAQSAADLKASKDLRKIAFHGAKGLDRDPFDAQCRHILIEDINTGTLVCSFRLLPLANGQAIDTCYGAQFYDLSALSGYTGPMLELGRFLCPP